MHNPAHAAVLLPSLPQMCACRLFRFPKPQLLVYTLLVVPVVYGAAKLLAASGDPSSATGSRDAMAALSCIILLPLPLVAFWCYVLWLWLGHVAAAHGHKRSRAHIMRTYHKPYGSSGAGDAAAVGADTLHAGDPSFTSGAGRRSRATLALLSRPEDNPTLIIRDRRTGEEEYGRGSDGSAGSDDGADRPPLCPVHGRGSAAPALAPARQAAASEADQGRPWRSVAGSSQQSAAGVLGHSSGGLRAGSPPASHNGLELGGVHCACLLLPCCSAC